MFRIFRVLQQNEANDFAFISFTSKSKHFVSISIDFVFLCFIKQAFCFDFNRFCFPLFHKASALFRFRFPFASKPSPHRQMPPLASTAVANHRSRERSTLASRRGSIRGSALHWRNPAEVAIQAIPVVRSEWPDCSPAIGKSREIFAGKGRRFNLPTTGRWPGDRRSERMAGLQPGH